MNTLLHKRRIYLDWKLATLLCVCILTMTACSRYSISVNDNVVYEPPTLFHAFNTPDDSLRQCINNTIEEGRLTSAEQLKQLVCPTGHIVELQGIETFMNIEQLGLANNAISSIAPLEKLPHLKQLNLSNNDIRDFSVIFQLKELVYLNVEGNNHANCDSLVQREQRFEINMPDHCR